MLFFRIVAVALMAAWTTWPQSTEDLYDSSVKLFEQGRPAQALSNLEKVVAARPGHAAAWKVMGVILASQGDYPAAEPALLRACRLDSRVPDACFYYASILYLQNKFKESLAELDGLTRDRRRHRIRALCLDALGRWEDAEAEYKRAIHVDPGSEDPRVDYAVALARQGRAEEGVPLLQLALKAGRQPARAELELGRLLLQLDRLQDARRHLESAVSLTPSSAQAHLLLGRTYARLGLAEKAAEHLAQGANAAK